jgi:hypothetical protein
LSIFNSLSSSIPLPSSSSMSLLRSCRCIIRSSSLAFLCKNQYSYLHYQCGVTCSEIWFQIQLLMPPNSLGTSRKWRKILPHAQSKTRTIYNYGHFCDLALYTHSNTWSNDAVCWKMNSECTITDYYIHLLLLARQRWINNAHFVFTIHHHKNVSISIFKEASSLCSCSPTIPQGQRLWHLKQGSQWQRQ